MCGEDPIGREGHGPRFSRAAGARLADVAEWEHGATTPVVAELGPPGLDTLDTLIRAGFAATRAQAIRWALDRIRRAGQDDLHQIATVLAYRVLLHPRSRPRHVDAGGNSECAGCQRHSLAVITR